MNKGQSGYFAKAGEIATILTIGTFLVLTAVSIVSSVFLQKGKQTTVTKAQSACGCVGGTCSGGCSNDGADCFQNANACIPAAGATRPCTRCDGTNATCTYHGDEDAAGLCYNGRSDGCVAPCQAGFVCCPGDQVQPTADPRPPGPCSYSDYDNCTSFGCPGADCQQCQDYTYKCNSTPRATPTSGANCPSGKIDKAGACNPACCSNDSECAANGPNQRCSIQNGYCNSGLSCAAVAPSQTQPLYARICGNNMCAWTFCNGTTTRDPVRNIDVPCQTSQATAPEPMCQSDTQCIPPVTNNTCFYLTDEIYYDQGKGFSHNVKFWSPAGGGDGHIRLSRNGVNTGLMDSAWNRGAQNPFVVGPEFTGGYNNNNTDSANFVGTADHCKNGIGSASISCGTGKNPDGTVFVRGGGCQLMNAPNAVPTAVPTIKPTTPTPPQASCTYASAKECQIGCANPSNCTSSGCPTGTYKCLDEIATPTPTPTPTSGPQSCAYSSFKECQIGCGDPNNCTSNGCTGGTYKCNDAAVPTSTPTPPPSAGNPLYGTVTFSRTGGGYIEVNVVCDKVYRGVVEQLLNCQSVEPSYTQNGNWYDTTLTYKVNQDRTAQVGNEKLPATQVACKHNGGTKWTIFGYVFENITDCVSIP